MWGVGGDGWVESVWAGRGMGGMGGGVWRASGVWARSGVVGCFVEIPAEGPRVPAMDPSGAERGDGDIFA